MIIVTSKHFTHLCYPISLVFHQHLNSHLANPGIPALENSNHTRGSELVIVPSFPITLIKL